ncbi:MAG: cation-translocating P-type ATPase [Spirochaetales bacterium]|nr:cation-translocating P-type ATPase [Spirochaetales bacterium]
MFFNESPESVLDRFGVDKEKGLADRQAQSLLEKHGPNRLAEKKQTSRILLFLEQFREIMVFILIAAAIISFILHDTIEAVIILLIVLLNAVLGFIQETRARRAIDALQKMSIPFARVRRDGRIREIDVAGLVPGDIVLLEAGNIVPADGRLIETVNLKIEESALTGESEPVEKTTSLLGTEKTALADRKNMAYKNTLVSYGRGEMLVTATGMQTEIGKIAGLLQSVEKVKSPLEKRLDRLGKVLAFCALGLIAIVMALVWFSGRLNGHVFKWSELLETAISMAVAAIPEGLAAVVTISLALGAGRMLKKQALMRNLPSVETLGSVTVICSDKTGTLTQNRMTVRKIMGCEHETGIDSVSSSMNRHDLLVLAAGSMANDSQFGTGKKEILGDPTETAIVRAAVECGLPVQTIQQKWKRIEEMPFDSVRKRMSTAHVTAEIPADFPVLPEFLGEKDRVVFCKGATDGLLEISDRYYTENGPIHMSPELRTAILAINEKSASAGLRVLGIAAKSASPGDDLESGLVLLGMVAMEDPVRPEAVSAVQTCLQAGIRPIMITGDHPVTALAIARQLGLSANNRAISGSELDAMNDAQLKKTVLETSVFARVSPEHKMRLIDALQAHGNIVSMTGDGVNDAPALKSADMGVAMGITGTDVSRQSADMVLLDDNFASIVTAVREGRTIYDNIRKFIKYILTGNVGEILVMLIAPFLGFPLPLLPLQILWINLVTDGVPGIAMGYEKSERNIMNRPPFPPNESIFARRTGHQILLYGVLVALASLCAGFLGRTLFAGNGSWQTMIFTTLTLCQMQLAISVRSNSDSLFRYGLFSNLPMFFTILVSIALQMMLIYLAPLQIIFRTVALNTSELLYCFLLSFSILAAAEIEKLVYRYKSGVNGQFGNEKACQNGMKDYTENTETFTQKD